MFGRNGRRESEHQENVGEIVSAIAITHPSWKLWWLALLGTGGLLGLLVICLAYLFERGVAIWGNNSFVVWALDIISYDWWMGIACGALLLSAVFLFHGRRGALSRLSQAVALPAGISAGIYPIIHLGRPWFFYWMFAYPNVMNMWPQFRSPLFWDETDIVGFLTVASIFWFLGMVPDFAVMRDHSEKLLRKRLYAIAALGWRGEASHWARWSQSCRLLALLGVLISINVQWGSSLMYAVSLEPGWHDTLLPVDDIINSIFAGAGAVAVVTSMVRVVYPLRRMIDRDELEFLAWVLLALGIASAFLYAADFFFTAFGGNSFQRDALVHRLTGSLSWTFWMMVGAAQIPVHVLWFRRARRSAGTLFVLGLLVMAGVWGDRAMSILAPLHHDFLPSSVHPWHATFWSIGTWLGTVGIFLAIYLLFLRYLPVVSIIQARQEARLSGRYADPPAAKSKRLGGRPRARVEAYRG